MIDSSDMDPNFSMNENNQIDMTNNPFLPSPENSNLPYDITAERIQLTSPMNFVQPSFFDGSNCNGFLEMDSIAKPTTVGSPSCVNKETDKDSGTGVANGYSSVSGGSENELIFFDFYI